MCVTFYIMQNVHAADVSITSGNLMMMTQFYTLGVENVLKCFIQKFQLCIFLTRVIKMSNEILSVVIPQVADDLDIIEELKILLMTRGFVYIDMAADYNSEAIVYRFQRE